MESNMKSLKKFLFILLIVFSFVSCQSTDVSGTRELQLNPKIVSGQMDNGMSYYVMNNQNPENRITLRLVVKAGSCVEEDDQKGVAHFIEHLAFNGTEHFEKNSIVDFFEKIGMNFGADLNAYTSFDETVYQLEVPADNPEYLEKALLILKDWACGITFEEEEIDKERGVINEEWRLRRGIQGRILDSYIPFVFKNSRYEERLPIGDMNVIQNIKRNRILDFYKKWYKPELMSVVAVGDVKADVLKNAILKTMKDIPASEEKIRPAVFNVPATNQKKVFILKDKEQPYTMIQIMQQDVNYVQPATEGELKEEFKKLFVLSILNQRFAEIGMSSNSPWLQASAISGSDTHRTSYNGFVIVPKDNLFTESLKKLFDEYDRFLLFGANESEVEMFKSSFLKQMEMTAKNKSSIKSSSIAAEIVSYILENSISMDEDYMYNLMQKIMASITVEDINFIAKEMFGNRGSQFFVVAPESKKDIPSEKQILEIWNNYRDNDLAEKLEEVKVTELMKRPSSKAKIVSKKSDSKLKINEYELENGLKIVTKKTDFDKDKIFISGISKGGASLISDEDFPSANAACSYALCSGLNGYSYLQINNFLKEKHVDLSHEISLDSEKISGSTNMNDLEYFLQYAYLSVTQPQFNDEGWERGNKYAVFKANSFGSSVDDVISETLWKTVFGSNIKYSPCTKEYVGKMNKEKAEKIYRERFSNAADFTYVFVGNFDEKKLLDLCCYYLGNIPGNKEKLEDAAYYETPYVKGKKTVTVKKGLEQQSTVFMSITGDLPLPEDSMENWTDTNLMNQLESVLDIRLRELIREDLGGAYGVTARASLSKCVNKREYEIIIYFGCEPSRTEELKNAAISVMEDLKVNKITEEEVQKLIESYKRTKELSLKNNNWWLNYIVQTRIFDSRPVSSALDSTTIPALITPENIMTAANKYFNYDNLKVIYLKPEK